MILQLNPPLPVNTPLGLGVAHVIIDYGIDFNSVFVVFLDSGEVKHFSSEQLRRTDNLTFDIDTKLTVKTL